MLVTNILSLRVLITRLPRFRRFNFPATRPHVPCFYSLRSLPAVGCSLLAVGCWLLAAGCWLLAVGCWLLAAGCCPLDAGCLLLLASGCWLLAAGWLAQRVHEFLHKIERSVLTRAGGPAKKAQESFSVRPLTVSLALPNSLLSDIMTFTSIVSLSVQRTPHTCKARSCIQ